MKRKMITIVRPEFMIKRRRMARVLVAVILMCTPLLVVSCGPAEESAGPQGALLPMYGNKAAAEADLSGDEKEPIDYSEFEEYGIPPLSPEEALGRFELEEGFRIELVAHEPDVIDPVAMDIDPDGRLWVAEMISYMPRHDLSDRETSLRERVPQGRIVVLEDTSGDGRMDSRRIFMKELILPRAIKVLDDGVLIGEPPYLWFLQDTTGDGMADRREKVSEEYGEPLTRNVEHMVNGLMWGMDNWIHSADIGARSFRRADGEWQSRSFEHIGQWGLAQDDWGRVYSSHNTRTLQTHLSPYGYSERHPDHEISHGINVNIAESEHMYPAHPTGVNRGYRIGQEVREDGTLKRSTSTCGPVIYRGHQFGDDYLGNAFVPEPAANLIKRLVGLHDDPGAIETEARFAYHEREFLTSTDERFRPVNLYNAPDGSIYVTDMYRGLFQHARFLTDFLRDYTVEHDLHKPLGPGRFGRIYRIVREDCDIDYESPRLGNMEPAGLVEILEHRNGLLRDQAQQLLVQRSPASALPLLEELVRTESSPYYTRLQALWTLEGYPDRVYPKESLFAVASDALGDQHPRVRAAAVKILEPGLRNGDDRVLERLLEIVGREETLYVRLQLIATLGESESPDAIAAVAALLDDDPGNPYFAEMALTGVYQQELDLIDHLVTDLGWDFGMDEDRDGLLNTLLTAAGREELPVAEADGIPEPVMELGEDVYGVCAACHGRQGEGVSGAGPAMDGSEWVTGPREPLIRILLHGFVDGEWSRQESAGSVMPAHDFLNDEELAAVATYIRRSWENSAPEVTPEQVRAIREQSAGRSSEWTPAELE